MPGNRNQECNRPQRTATAKLERHQVRTGQVFTFGRELAFRDVTEMPPTG